MRLSLAVAIILVVQSIVAGAGGNCLCATHSVVPAAEACCSQKPMDEGCCCQINKTPEVPDDRAVLAPSVSVQLPATVACTYAFVLPVTDGSARPDDVDPAVPQLFLQSTRIERGPPA